MLARAVSDGSRLNFWKTNPIFLRRIFVRSASFILAMSSPSMSTLPLVAWAMAPSRCINVDFPEPEGPMIAHSSPDRIFTLTPRKASTSTSPSLYVFFRSEVSSNTLIGIDHQLTRFKHGYQKDAKKLFVSQ